MKRIKKKQFKYILRKQIKLKDISICIFKNYQIKPNIYFILPKYIERSSVKRHKIKHFIRNYFFNTFKEKYPYLGLLCIIKQNVIHKQEICDQLNQTINKILLRTKIK
jgi:ribonuclease P protein component